MNQEGKTWTIYKLISPSEKVYIGITSQKPISYRWKNGKGYSENTKIGQAINKYGWDNFQHEVIEENIISLEEAKLKEQYWINFYDSYRNGYNSTIGGDTVSLSRSTNLPIYQIDDNFEIVNKFETIAEAGRCLHTRPSNIAEAAKQNGNQIKAKGFYWCLEKDYSESWQPKENNQSKKVICIETKVIYPNEIAAAKAVNKTQEAIAACCNRTITTCAGFHWAFLKDYDENWSPRENIQKNYSKVRKAIICVETGQEFESITAASKELNICRNTINRSCKSPTHTAGGYHFKYKESEKK